MTSAPRGNCYEIRALTEANFLVCAANLRRSPIAMLLEQRPQSLLWISTELPHQESIWVQLINKMMPDFPPKPAQDQLTY
jgi:hypothetical protein